MLNARDNAIQTIRFGKPEYVASGLSVHQLCYHGCNHEGYDGGGHECAIGSQWVDIWGTRWHKEHAGVMGFPRGNPLADVSALASYRWPNPDDQRICESIYRGRKDFQGGDQFLGGSHRDTLWEKAYMLVGMENMMVYLHEEPGFAREVLGRIMDFQLGIARHYLSVGIEVAGLGDDLGTQLGPLLSPDLVREFFVPQYRRLFDLYKSQGVIIGFHSCGCIGAFLDMWMELGVDVLNPIQVTANDLGALREKTAGRMSLQGGISTVTMVNGPVEAIEGEVRERLWQLGRNGGYFCAPDQGMPWPAAHWDAYRRTLDKHGRYPLRPEG